MINYVLKALKSDFHLLKRFCVIWLIKSPFDVLKNAFYFILKALFSRYLSFCHNFLLM